ncbi:hypothetical protein LCGC14_2861220 [marine sediment metagenome]|uniref:Uncharacterized protein n=1 Tax=marine sediment metagenome TaxID=412755 RepID=A0A0F8Y5U8_9ZZZZ|nr:hypothetical protein [Candidatus Scalindua sp.]HDZ14113.1 hypothetical protein [Pricia sp.]
MAKARVFYRTDGGITVRRMNKSAKLPTETDTEYFDRTMPIETRSILVGATYEDINESALPVYASATRNKWRKKAGGGVKIDNSVVTTIEKRKKVEDDLDAELAKPAPNAIAAMRLQRKLDKREY